MTSQTEIRAALEEAIQKAHGQTALARLIAEKGAQRNDRRQKVTQAHVHYWLTAGSVPPDVAPDIEAETGVSKRRLCPNFPWPNDGQAKPKRRKPQ